MKKNTFFLATLLFLLSFNKVFAQQQYVDLTTRITKCTYIFEGRVINSQPYVNSAGNYVYTSNTIQITKIFKGDLTCGTVELITDDGIANGIRQFTSHRLHLTEGTTGIFACNITNKELSSVDFYVENNTQELEATYEELSLIRYQTIDNIVKAFDITGVYDSLVNLYNLTQFVTGISIVDCNSAPIISATSNSNNQKLASLGTLPTYQRSEYDTIMAHMKDKAKKVRKSLAKSTKTLTYTMSNTKLTGCNPYYYEFDVNLKDDVGGVYFNNGLIRLNYSNSIFGSNIVGANKIQVTRGTLISNTTVYDNPTPADISTSEIAIPLTLNVPFNVNLAPLGTTPTQAVHVKMEISNCGNGTTIDFTSQTIMEILSFYGTSVTDTFGVAYDAVSASQSINVTDCTANINSISPDSVNGGVSQQVTIKGHGFGCSQGLVYLKNANDGGLTDINVEYNEYPVWNDSTITFYVMGIDSGFDLNSLSSGIQVPGSGKVKIHTVGGANIISTNDLTVYYSVLTWKASNSAKYRSNVVSLNGAGGYQFKVDSNIWKHPDTLACIKKAMRNWTCVTGVNWEIVGATNPTSPTQTALDGINQIQFGTFSDPAIVALATTYPDICNNNAFGVELDVVINQNALFTTDTTISDLPANKLDLFAALLHEFGHCHQLNHVNDPDAIMYWQAKNPGTIAAQRAIYLASDGSAIDGGNDVMNVSTTAIYTGCTGVSSMIFKSEPSCYVLSNHITNVSNSTTSLMLYPNPTDETIKLQFSSKKSQTTTISIIDVLGRVVIQKAIQINNGENKIEIDVTQLSKGFYSCYLRSDNKNQTAKFIKE